MNISVQVVRTIPLFIL